MTTSLYKAFEKASKLSQKDQNLLAAQILDDIKNEKAWKSALQKPSSKLSILASRALKEFKTGNTKKIGFDEI